MNEANLYQKITELAKDLGFVSAGVAEVCPIEEEFTLYENAMESGCFADMEYLKRNCHIRKDPGELLEGARSILVFLAPYGSRTATPEREIEFRDGIVERYKVAQYALGRDYHKVIRKKLTVILDYIKNQVSEARGRVFADTAPILERIWGVRAGLGFIGKNNFLISKEAGIRNFIGIIVTDVDFVKAYCNTYLKSHCGECMRCIESCPTGALSPYRLDAGKCISYLTIEKRGSNIELNRSMAKERDGWIFGCDACMNACPWNSRNREGWNEFKPQQETIPAAHLRRR